MGAFLGAAMSNEAAHKTDEEEEYARQQMARGSSVKPQEWPKLLFLRTDNQQFAAAVLLCISLAFGGWYIWRATSSPGLIDIDRTEPTNSKLVVNVNTAVAAELMLLPEIGIKMAHLIVKERDAGPYRNAEDFGRRIKGIGPKTLPKIVPYLEGWTNEPQKK